MISFKIRKTGEVKNACSFHEEGEKIYIKFSPEGKEYGYFKNNIEIIHTDQKKVPFRVYSYKKECYKCHKETEILTYVTYKDKPEESVVFPYDFDRLLAYQNITAHLQDPGIEYYGINVIGDIKEFDCLLAEKYPDQVQNKYSQIQKRTYPMNVCCHCGCGQGWYYIYRDVNQRIQVKERLVEKENRE